MARLSRGGDRVGSGYHAIIDSHILYVVYYTIDYTYFGL